MLTREQHNNALALCNNKKYAHLTTPNEREILGVAAGDWACGGGTASGDWANDKAITILRKVAKAVLKEEKLSN